MSTISDLLMRRRGYLTVGGSIVTALSLGLGDVRNAFTDRVSSIFGESEGIGLDVTITETNTPVQTGDDLEVTVELENTHDSTLREEPQLVVGHDPTVVDSEAVAVEAEESETITLGFETAEVRNPQEFPVRVETRTDTDEVSVYVYVDEPPLEVSIAETNDPVNAGDDMVITAEIENAGESSLEQDIDLIVGHDPQHVDTETVRVDSGETEIIELGFETATVPNTQEFPVRVESEGDTAETDVEVIGTDDENGDFEVEFHSCTEASASGTFDPDDSITVQIMFIDPTGPADAHPIFNFEDHVDTQFDGTVSFQVRDEDAVLSQSAEEIVVGIEDAGFGTIIRSVRYNWPQEEISESNPENCLEERQPEPPVIDVADVTPTEEGTFDVTFEHENPNDLEVMGGEFVEGTTDDELDSLEPGDSSSTVEWTPESDDERLIWENDLETYFLDDDLRAETEPAGEYREREVTIESIPDSVEPGDVLEVTATVVGSEGDEVDLVIDSETVDSTTITTSGESLEFEYELPSDESASELTVRVEIGETSDEATVEVLEGEAELEVSIVETNAPVEPGDDLEVVAEVENIGDAESDSVTLTFFVDGVAIASDDVSPGPGESSQVTFVYSIRDDDVGDLDIAVTMSATETAATEAEAVPATDEATTTVPVEDPSEPDLIEEENDEQEESVEDETGDATPNGELDDDENQETEDEVIEPEPEPETGENNETTD